MRIFYTDGSAGANEKKAGGWAFLEVVRNKISFERYDADFSFDVTSNQMELKAAIEAVKQLQPGDFAQIHSDSQYVIKGVCEWVHNWKKNNWLTAKKTPVVNQDLWEELLDNIKGKKVQWIWVRSHANDPFNHRVDELAKKCYVKPEEIDSIIKERHQLIMKPTIGSVIYFDNPSKKYAVILNDVRVGETLGFLARLLANSFGHELDFFSYNGDKFTTIEKTTEKEQRLTLKTIEQFKDNVDHEFYQLKETCKHHIVKNDDSATCSICESDFGWWCPDSPDHCCHYFSENGRVRLNNGNYAMTPKDHDPDYENYDDCIFCHAPNERK